MADTPIASTELSRHGWASEQYHPRQILGSTLKHVNALLRDGHFGLVWIEIPASGKSVPPKRWSAAVSEIVRWLQTASVSGVLAVVLGQRGRHWQQEDLMRAQQSTTIHESDHALCHFGIRINPAATQPSEIKYHMLSTTPFKNHPCKCPKGTTHQYDLAALRGQEGSERLRAKALTRLYGELIPKLLPLCFSFHRPESENKGSNIGAVKSKVTELAEENDVELTFPTFAREAEKAKKKAGVVAKKRKMYVEPHFDDLGDELSGLGRSIQLYAADTLVMLCKANTFKDNIAQVLTEIGRFAFSGHSAPDLMPQWVYRAQDINSLEQYLRDFTPGSDICEFVSVDDDTAYLTVHRTVEPAESWGAPQIEPGMISAFAPIPVDQDLYGDGHTGLDTVAHWPRMNAITQTSMFIGILTNQLHSASEACAEACRNILSAHQQDRGHFCCILEEPTWAYQRPRWDPIFADPTVHTFVVNQCMLGKPALRENACLPTRIVTNSSHIADAFAHVRYEYLYTDNNTALAFAPLPTLFVDILVEGLSHQQTEFFGVFEETTELWTPDDTYQPVFPTVDQSAQASMSGTRSQAPSSDRVWTPRPGPNRFPPHDA